MKVFSWLLVQTLVKLPARVDERAGERRRVSILLGHHVIYPRNSADGREGGRAQCILGWKRIYYYIEASGGFSADFLCLNMKDWPGAEHKEPGGKWSKENKKVNPTSGSSQLWLLPLFLCFLQDQQVVFPVFPPRDSDMERSIQLNPEETKSGQSDFLRIPPQGKGNDCTVLIHKGIAWYCLTRIHYVFVTSIDVNQYGKHLFQEVTSLLYTWSIHLWIYETMLRHRHHPCTEWLGRNRGISEIKWSIKTLLQ